MSSVAGSESLGVRSCMLVGHNSQLSVLRQCLLILLGIHELIAGVASRIKPLQQGIGFPGPLFRECDRSVTCWVLTLRGDGLESRIQHSPVRIEDLYHILRTTGISQSEYVRPRGQDLAWNLDRLTESHCGVQVRLVRVSSEFKKKSK